MAVGEVWHSKVQVKADGSAPDIVEEFPAGSYLVLAKTSFEQDANVTYAEDSSGWLQLLAIDLEARKKITLDYCKAEFGAVETSKDPVLEYPHELDQPDFKIVGWTVHGLKGGVAVINALVSTDAKSELRLVIGTENARVLEGAMSVMECSVPPRRAAQSNVPS